MSDERQTLERHDLNRWLPILGMVVAGLVLFFWLGSSTPIVLDVDPTVSTP